MDDNKRSVMKTNTRGKKKQKQVAGIEHWRDSAAGRFSYVLELGSASIWEYLASEDVVSLFLIFPGTFSQEFIDAVALKAIDSFCVENKTHLGLQCGCDWMRSLSFLPRSNDKCSQNSEYFKIETPPPIVQLPGGSRALLNALILTKKLIQPFLTISDHRDAVLVPLVCPLTSQECPTMSSKAAITRAMNNIFTGAGSRFFYKFKPGSKHPYCDEIEDHWTAINGSSCHFCNELTGPGALRSKRAMTQNYCARLYRPLKTAMELNLQHVRFVRQRRISRRDRHLQFRQYKCLVAGVTEDGVLCGLYFRKGYNYFW